MLPIEAVDHVGIRVSDKTVALAFYEKLGFEILSDTGFEAGHPVIMRHPSGVVLNILGPANVGAGENILMDASDKYPGITHFSLRVSSLIETKKFLAANDIPITGTLSFGKMSGVFIRDPDRNVIELDCYASDEDSGNDTSGYSDHP